MTQTPKRLETTFKALSRPALITFIMASDPTYEESLALLKSLPEAGADMIELGMPFTDPVADGPVIQLAGQRALKAGGSMIQTLRMVRAFRETNTQTPLVLMGYYNPVFRYGPARFVKEIAQAGIDGIILVDLPPEESQEIQTLCKTHSLDLIRLITPTTDTERLGVILNGASGFLYYVSITGVTGAARADLEKIKPHLANITAQTTLPIAIGFGIKTPEDAQTMGTLGEAIVVGSSLIQTLCDKGIEAVHDHVRTLSQALKASHLA